MAQSEGSNAPLEGSNARNSAHTAIEETTTFIENLLELRDKDGRRVMSTSTMNRVSDLLKFCKDTTKTPEEKQAAVHCRGELERRLGLDAKYASAMRKLEAMQHDQFFLRYGDYYAAVLGRVRRQAKQTGKTQQPSKKTIPPAELSGDVDEDTSANPDTPIVNKESAPKILFTPWAHINGILSAEEDRMKDWEIETQGEDADSKPETPMTDYVQEVTRRTTDYDFELVRKSIHANAIRNKLAHSHLTQLAEENKWFKLAHALPTTLRTWLPHQRHVNNSLIPRVEAY
ncbi:hypothetical protein B0T26DRAFT_707551 [Lasiosphaeria miniovina]|uniref:Uncharacterized protein n=1 Tax=Lasiosphaeria miniovina TaxID=1954250 RepID=A0AA40DZ46_9PEZI|nr:uncharacterized protein B0T26DRAFT_707551 [Lasiosphaeria miniovina]KAK0716868.1 hypothetical protein B0T26DRAFT_707551 [Lasiosphaeria miniovina]